LRIKRPDTGEARWLMRRGEYLHDAETAGLRFSGVIYDITNAKSIESQLRTLNETLESRVEERTRERDRIWQVSRDLYVLCKTDGRCSITNPAWQTELGYGPNDAQDRRLTDFVFHDDLSIAHAAIQKVSQGELVQAVDLRMLSKDGTQRRVIWTFVPEGTSFFGAGRDITQRHQLEEQLRQSQKMEAVGQLTGGIAHDFNNLLTGIIGALELVRRRLKQGRFDTLDQLMDAATASAHRAAALTHRLLAFSRRQSLDVRALDVNQLVSSVEDLLQRTLGEQIVLSVKLQSDLWLGLSDANQLENALLNLVINARDAMPNGGELTIATENSTASRKSVRNHPEFAPGDYVMIAVSDTGMGMPPEVLAKAFDPFFTTKPIGKGTGLGLSMIYGFAKQSGGHVEIDSAIGRGTTVKLYMPRFTGVSVSEGHNSKLSTLPRAKGETILVVEDDPSVRMLVLEALKDLDYDIVEATDSQTALPVLQSKRRLDLMISDVGLPGMNGHELAHIAREARAELRILFMTGYTEKAGIRANFLVAGMEMIAKPFTIDALASKIREMLRS
jgi:PAS domain S-box-containing protein